MCNSGKNIQGKPLHLMMLCVWILAVSCSLPSSFAKTLDIKLDGNATRHICVSNLNDFGAVYERIYNISFVSLAFLLPTAVMLLVMIEALIRKVRELPQKPFGSSVAYSAMYLVGWTPYGSIWLYYWAAPLTTELDMHAIFYTKIITFCFLLLSNLWPLHLACCRQPDKRGNSARKESQNQEQSKQWPLGYNNNSISTIELPPSPADLHVCSFGNGSPGGPVNLPIAKDKKSSSGLKAFLKSKFQTRKSSTVAANNLEYRSISSRSGVVTKYSRDNWQTQTQGAPVYTAVDDSGVIAEFFELDRDSEEFGFYSCRKGQHISDFGSAMYTGQPFKGVCANPFGLVNPSFDLSGDESLQGGLSSDSQTLPHITDNMRNRSRGSQLAMRYNLNPEMFQSTQSNEHTDV